ncbi:MAG: SemiSWEET transporter [Sphingobacteriia bacterium]|nr:SemiSWEET transporter [Sphingobacteriia bacterium]
MQNSIELIGLIAGACTAVSFVPQVIKVWKSRSVQDISLLMYVLFCTGLASWVAYGVYMDSISLILWNALTLVLAVSILIMKIRWK